MHGEVALTELSDLAKLSNALIKIDFVIFVKFA